MQAGSSIERDPPASSRDGSDCPRWLPQSAAWLALADAELSRLEGASDPDAWAASVDAWQGLGRPYAVAYARWREAEALLAARGDRKLATALLREVVEAARRIGRRTTRTRGRVPGASRPDFARARGAGHA